MYDFTRNLYRFLLYLIIGSSVSQASNIPLNSYSLKDGLSSSTVKAIIQDSVGYIWVGTKNGLNRLDGYEIKTYFHLPGQDVKQPNDIVSIDRLSDGMFWIGTFSGIVLFDPENEQFIDVNQRYVGDGIPTSVVVGVHEDPSHNVWVATKSGLYEFKNNGECSCVKDMCDVYIHMMAVASPYELLLDVVNQGLVLFDVRTSDYKIIDRNNRAFYLMKGFTDSNSRVWLGEDLANFYRYYPDSNNTQRVKYTSSPDVSLENNYIHDITEYNDSTLLLATDAGLVAYDIVRSHLYSLIDNRFSIADRMMTVYKDRQGGLWMGTFCHGIRYYHSKMFSFIHHPLSGESRSSAGDVRVIGSMVESQCKLWVGCDDGLISMDLSHPEKKSRFDIDVNSNRSAGLYYVYPNSADELYLYLLNQGVYSFNVKNGTINKVLTDVAGERQVRAMARDACNRLWIAEDDLACIDVESQKPEYNLSTNYNGATRYMLTQDILRYNDDMIVGVRTNGLWVFKRNPLSDDEPYFKGERSPFKELEYKNISVLYEDSDGNIWVGTYDDGVYRCNLENETIDHYSVDNGLLNNSICAILEERVKKNIWVSSITGLSQIKLNGDVIVNYSSGSGFPLNEISPKSMIQASNGHIYVGGSNGIAEFDPVSLSDGETTIPVVKISVIETLNPKNSPEHIEINNCDNMDVVRLPYDNSSIRVKFSALDFISPKSYRYAYQMEGLDRTWHRISDNEVIYSNLSPGDYVLRIKGCNSEGTWSDVATTVAISVAPAMWLTWWAKTLYAIFVISFIIVVVRYYYGKKTTQYKHKVEQENIERNYRTHVELFTNFSHELRTPLTLIINQVKDIVETPDLSDSQRVNLKRVYKNSNRLLLLVNQLLDFRKIEHGVMRLKISNLDIKPFVAELVDSFYDLLARRNLKITSEIDCTGNDLWVDAELMSKVMFNLLSNAVKHSPKGGEIVVSVMSGSENNVVFSVKDSGEGISAENQLRIFDPFFQIGDRNINEMYGSGVGLSFVHYVVKLHSGKVWVESEIGKGATFYVSLRQGKEHYKDSDVVYADQPVSQVLDVEKESIMRVDAVERKNETDIASAGGACILIAEDDDELRQYVVSKLSQRYNVIETANGKEALDVARERMPDLIVSDVMMPVMDGLTLCREVKNDTTLSHVPVVLLTAKSLEEHIVEGYGALADDYVIKPFNSRILISRIDSIVKNREKLRQAFDHKLGTVETPVKEIVAEDPLMGKLVELITENIENPDLSIEMLYNTLGMSRSQFFRKIKAISELSPNKLLLNIRMKIAVEKLSTGKQSISEVAYAVGFSDPAYFSKVFKSVFNQTPTEYLAGLESV